MIPIEWINFDTMVSFYFIIWIIRRIQAKPKPHSVCELRFGTPK
jgi:hypothetical protein